MNVEKNTDRHFKGQLDSETVECFYRKHWAVLAGNILGFFIFMTVLIFAIYNYRGLYDFFSEGSSISTFLAFLTVGLFTIYIHRFFLRIMRYYLDIVVITNYRIVSIDKSVYLRDTKSAIDLDKIQNIKKIQNGIVKRMLSFGELIITLSSTSTTKILNLVPNPEYHFRKINHLKRSYIKERLAYRKPQENRDFKKIDPQSKVYVVTEESISGLS